MKERSRLLQTHIDRMVWESPSEVVTSKAKPEKIRRCQLHEGLEEQCSILVHAKALKARRAYCVVERVF